MHKKSIFLIILGCLFLIQQLGASAEPNVDQYSKYVIDSYEFSIHTFALQKSSLSK